MIRTKNKPQTGQLLHALASELMGRATLSSSLGIQYGGARDIYQALGYQSTLTYNDFLSRYGRQDIAKAIIDRPVKATWQGKLELIESDQAEDTSFEEAWEALDKQLGLKARLSRVDRLTGIGEYGVLLLGLNDCKDPSGFAKPVQAGTRKLMYVKPFGQDSAKIESYENDTKNKRYGLPLLYSINVMDLASGVSTLVQVHHTRAIHITDDPLESDVKGTPRLMAVYNRLMDLEKLIGGDAEMFWRGARPGYTADVAADFQMTPAMQADLKEQVDEYENNLRRILVNEGLELKSLAQQIADPSNHVDIQIQMISAVTGIPKRVLTGSEQGELASTQDSNAWKDYVQSRREDHAEPNILRPFVSRCIELGVLPTPVEDYDVKWSDLYAMSEKAKVEVGKGRANALREYTYNPIAEAIIPPDAFLEFFLGLSKEQITLIRKMRDNMVSEEELNQSILDSIDPPEPKVLPAGKPVPLKRTKKAITV